MLSFLETIKICVLLHLICPALTEKNDNGTDFKEFDQTLDCKQAPVISSNHLQIEIDMNQSVKPLDQRQTTGKVNQDKELEDQLQTNSKENFVTKFNEQQSTKMRGPRGMCLQDKYPTKAEKDSVTTVQMKIEKLPQMNSEEDHEIEHDVKVGKSQKNKPKDQLFTILGESRKGNTLKLMRIRVEENRETDFRDSPLMWTRMQTRGKNTTKGPILGFKKRSFKAPRSVTNCFSKASSYIEKSLKKIGTRNGKSPSLGTEKQPSAQEKALSAESNVVLRRPSLESDPSQRKGQRPSYEPTNQTHKKYEGFCSAYNIKNIVMIPGSGEFVYDTKIQQKTAIKKTTNNQIITSGPAQSINGNSNKKMSDAMLSLNQLKEDLPNVEWVSVVVNWFADGVNIEDCVIYPAVEFKEGFIMTPDDWQVGDLTRENARLISRDSDGNPRYGGTVSDGALIRYINELHSRGYKVMLYPMLVLDTENKEWRGRITGPVYKIGSFFNIQYNRFIKHYSNIARQTKVQGFIIGSEFVELTRIQNRFGVFPAVSELVKLAQEVKTELGTEVIVTYAADWTEYHHSYGAWYALDDLWSSKYIDVVGINAYFPLTEGPEPPEGFSVQDVMDGWTKGGGFDYSVNYSNLEKHEKEWYFDNSLAWKNIEAWWNMAHYNPNGMLTKWRPAMKKIWFTEFGFPSVDGCTNEPYVFVDASGEETVYPRYSNKKVSFQSQKIAIEGTVKKWQNSDMVEKMFLYAWDARPFPYFPTKREIWGDGANWETGHWVQGKIGRILGNKRQSVVSSRRSLSLPKPLSSVSGGRYPRQSSGKP